MGVEMRGSPKGQQVNYSEMNHRELPRRTGGRRGIDAQNDIDCALQVFTVEAMRIVANKKVVRKALAA